MDKQKDLDQLFSAAKHQQAVYSFDEAQQSFLAGISTTTTEISPTKNSIFSLKNWIIMLTIVSTIALTFFLGSSHEKTVQPTLHVSTNKPTETTKKQQQPSAPSFALQSTIGKEMLQHLLYYEALTDSLVQANTTVIPTIDEVIVEHKNRFYDLPQFDEGYTIPKLTEEEIKANNKQKKSMLKALEKFDKKVYAHLVSGTFDYQGKITSVQSFLIQKTEVSNLEYRTFLFDLLIQGRNDDFLKARPDHKQWSILANQEKHPYEDHYFSHPAYDNFPVVNISREGAELYCIWLSQEVYKILDDKKKGLFNDVRLPMREEWVMAASIEGKKGPFAWDGQFTRNSSGCYLANYQLSPEEYAKEDSIAKQSNKATDLTAPVSSYYPNDFGIYNMSGNVAEMVYNDFETKAAGTAGGGWRNTEEEIKILGPDPYPGVTTANPGIGFRVVMTVK